MERIAYTFGGVVGYHGCERELGQQLLRNEIVLTESDNTYDWLGRGAYFWVDSAERGIEWARWKQQQGDIHTSCVVGAFLHLGLCLSLTDYGVMDRIKEAHSSLKELITASGAEFPKNSVKRNGYYMKRKLDCAVIDMLHFLRKEEGKEDYDTVLGIFEEGDYPYTGASFKEKTHIQIAVRNPRCVVGYFQVPGFEIL